MHAARQLCPPLHLHRAERGEQGSRTMKPPGASPQVIPLTWGASATPALPSAAPAPQCSLFPAPQAQARLGLAPLRSSLPRLPLLYLHVYFMISIFNASAL